MPTGCCAWLVVGGESWRLSTGPLLLAALARVAPEVVSAMLPFLTEHWGNPSSAYIFGHQVAAHVEEARTKVAALINAKAPRDVDEALTLPAGGGSLGEKLVATVAKIGEKISFRRFARLETPAGTPGMVVPYIHAGGKIGVLVAVSGADRSNTAVAALAKDLAMQVAAANPSYVGRNDVPASVIEREKTIYREQAKASGKPDKILDKIADGKLEKYYGDFCIVEQAFIKDLAAGTYRQLVEAAESCQVAIIHPGAPRNPNEPGLEELLVRAEPFR